MVKIAPSILSADFANLERDIRSVEKGGADYLHLDVMDGIFVPNISIGIPVVSSVRKITDLPLDVHLMIDRPIRLVKDFIDAGSDRVTFHLEADLEENIFKTIDLVKSLGRKVGLSLRPKTPVEALLPYLNTLDLVLIMSVEPGFGGQSFMPDQLPKMSALRKLIDDRKLSCEIEVDGGINNDTAKLCVDAGVDVLISGNTIFKAYDRAAAIKELRGI
jgi:ribulose-phosphate 3-epimerase